MPPLWSPVARAPLGGQGLWRLRAWGSGVAGFCKLGFRVEGLGFRVGVDPSVQTRFFWLGWLMIWGVGSVSALFSEGLFCANQSGAGFILGIKLQPKLFTCRV